MATRKDLSVQSGRNVQFADDAKATAKATNAKRAGRAPKVPSKECRVCHIWKPLSDFRVKRSRPDGHDTLCALCAQAWLANRKAVLATQPVGKPSATQRASKAAANAVKAVTPAKTRKPAASRSTKSAAEVAGDKARAAAAAKRTANVRAHVAAASK